jgi:glycerol-3-phosphate dehydrogenase
MEGTPLSDQEFSHRTRAAALATMAREPVDLLVIGGGITGAGIARDAALRGLRTALIDKGDFGGGTSSASSRLVHGGLRYLEQREFGLVFEASRERRVLLRTAPHLVRPLPFLFPIYRGSRVAAWKLRAGLWLYDLLATFRNVGRHRWVGPTQVRQLEPGLRDRELKGAGLYYDAQTNDARLVLATLRAAAQAGAAVANYAEASALAQSDGRVRGAVVRDHLSGETQTVRALVVVNAAGPWSDAVRRLDGSPSDAVLRPTKGVHVVVPRSRLGHTRAITLFSPIDGRVMFVLPWGDLSYIGTTDTDDAGSPDTVRATAADVVYLLRSANAFVPRARLGAADVVSTWAGLRPLLAPPERDAGTASAVSREHRILESPSGLMTIAGGKLTTYRVMARELVDRVVQRLHQLDGRPAPPAPPTDRLPLPGGESADLDVLVEAAQRRGVSDATARHLVGNYGSEWAAVLNLVDKDRALGRSVITGRPELLAEVAHGVEREMAVRLVDVLMRRLAVFHSDPGHGRTVAPAVASVMGRLLGWDEEREMEEVAEYYTQLARARGFTKELARASAPLLRER